MIREIRETDHRFEVRPSTVPGAGYGLFAVERIPANDYLEIIGVMVDVAGPAHLCTRYADPYKFAAEPAADFCHAVVPCGYAALVNHADSPARQNVAIAHLPAGRTPRNPDAGQAVYLAVRDIEPGEEVLGNYNRRGDGRADDLLRWRQLIAANLYGLGRLLPPAA